MRPLTELDKQIDKVKKNVKTVATYAAAAFGGAAAAAWHLAETGSHANETASALADTFKENTAAVNKWAKDSSKAMGRSFFDMQESALKFGAFLGPVFGGAGADVALMSEQLSALAVDLAAFYDISDKKAMDDLFSGMAGETEAVRKLGIDISDTTLEDMNKRVNGDNRTMRALTLNEKASLRLQKILIDTVDKQGRAVKEAGEWAGRLKKVEGRLKTLAVVYGRRLLPYMKAGLGIFEGMLETGVRFVENLETIASRARALAVTAGILTAAWVAQNFQAIKLVAQMYHLKFLSDGFYKNLAKAGIQAVKIGAVFYGMEDFITFLRGGESLVGKLLTAITGLKNPLKAMTQGYEMFFTMISNGVIRMMNELGEMVNFTAIGKMAKAKLTGNTEEVKRLEKEREQRVWQGTIDPKLGLKREASMRFDAVQSGDVDSYLANASAEDNQQSALEKFKAERKALIGNLLTLSKNGTGFNTAEDANAVRDWATKINLRDEDVNAGFLSQEQATFLRPRGNMTIGDIIVHNNSADPVEVGKAARKAVQDLLDETDAAEGEEE
jgi:hypothetical protein